MPGTHVALGGGGGLVHWLVRLVIWHEIWRVIRLIWRIPTFGPVLFVLIVLAVIGTGIWTGRGFRGPARLRRRRIGGSAGYGTGAGPRDW
jgi:hypothetical protein